MRGLVPIYYLLGWMFCCGPDVVFPEGRIIQFGKIKEGEVAEVEVKMNNSGDMDLIIYQAITTCNCTKVEYPRVIHPSDTGTIIITVNTSGKFGKESIVIKLKDNTDNQYSVIRVDLDVCQ